MKYRNVELPDGLKPLANEYIKSVLDSLAENDKLNMLDSASYYMLAGQYNTYIECKELEAKNGLTTVSPTGLISIAPWVKISKECLTNIVRLSQEIGLTNRSRKSIDVLSKDAPDETPLQKFMKMNEQI